MKTSSLSRNFLFRKNHIKSIFQELQDRQSSHLCYTNLFAASWGQTETQNGSSGPFKSFEKILEEDFSKNRVHQMAGWFYEQASKTWQLGSSGAKALFGRTNQIFRIEKNSWRSWDKTNSFKLPPSWPPKKKVQTWPSQDSPKQKRTLLVFSPLAELRTSFVLVHRKFLNNTLDIQLHAPSEIVRN